MTYGPLPGLRFTWTAYADGYTFTYYNVYRRPLRTLLTHNETVTVTESSPRVLLPTTDLFDGYQGAIAVRFSFPWDNTTEPGGGTGTPTVWEFYEDADNYLWLYYDETSNSYKFSRRVSGTTTTVTIAASVTLNADVTLIAYWTSAAIGLSLNGASFQTSATSSGEIDQSLLDIGSARGFYESSIAVDWFLTFSGTIANADATAMYAWSNDEFGDYPPSFDSINELSTALTTAIPSCLWVNEEETAHKVAIHDWVRIAEIDDSAKNFFTDRRTASGQIYQYTVTATATVYGETVESERQSPPSADSNTHTKIAIHNVNNESDYILIKGRASRLIPTLESAYVQARGRQQRTAQYGELEDSRIVIEPITHLLADKTDWDLLRTFFTKQREAGAIFCVRPGHSAESYYVQIDTLVRNDSPKWWAGSIELQEVYFDEEVEA